MKLSIKLILV